MGQCLSCAAGPEREQDTQVGLAKAAGAHVEAAQDGPVKPPAATEGNNEAEASSESKEVAVVQAGEEPRNAGDPWKYHLQGPPIPACEGDRLETVKALHLEEKMSVEAPPDPEIENILKLVSSVFNAPNALVALFDDRRIFIRETVGGFKRGDFPWRFSFCAWTMASKQDTIMVINDATKDARFAENPYVKAGQVRFYCGAPLIASNGHRLGTLCFADDKPREMDPQQAMILGNFAEMVVRHVEKDIALQLRSQDNAVLSHAYRNLKRAIDCFEHCVVLLDTGKPGWSILYTNPAWEKTTGSSRASVPGKLLGEVMEMVHGGLPSKSHCEAVAAGKQLTLEGVRMRASWLAHNALPGSSSKDSLAPGSRERRSQDRFSSGSKRLVLRLRPAGQQPLDDATVGLAVPPWVAQHAIEDPSRGCYYFMTVEVQDRAQGHTRSSLLSHRTSTSLHNASSPLAGLTLGQLLGSGSFGSVYAGQWLGAPVAIKVINQDLRQLQSAGVQMEALLGSELRHPHIVSTLTYAVKQIHMEGVSTTFTDDTARGHSGSGANSASNNIVAPTSPAGTGAALLSGNISPERSGGAASPTAARSTSGAGSVPAAGVPRRSKDGGRPLRSLKPEAFPGNYAIMELEQGALMTPLTECGTLAGQQGAGDLFAMSAHTPSKVPPPATQQQTWIVLEYCDKGSLQDAVDRGWLREEPSQVCGGPNMAAIVATGLEVASALLYLHSHGIVHGDLSAWNVLLTTSGANAMFGSRGFIAKVADFGLSRSLDIQTRIQTRTYGTITHQPPETLLDGMVSRETDTYSLGVLLWQMFTGSRPWVGMSHAQIIMSVVSRSASLRFPDDTPDDYAALAYACLSHSPKDRPHMSDVCSQLEIMKAKYCQTPKA